MVVDDVDRLLGRVKESARGWLPLPVYRRLYDTAAAAGGGDFVEIGTAQGAATIAMALGAKSAGKPFRILTADEFILGSRPVAASVEEKGQIVRRGFEAFGVAEPIELVVGSTAELIEAGDPRDIRLLLIDADGCIDRDLALLHGRLAADCRIVIDDIDDRNYLKRKASHFYIDQKHRLTFMLVDRFVGAGLLLPLGVTGQTGWFAKGPASLTPHEIERLALPAYRSLIFPAVRLSGTGMRYALYRLAETYAPWLVRAWRRSRRKG
jgi:predicted O-methyltransferase YrrM